MAIGEDDVEHDIVWNMGELPYTEENWSLHERHGISSVAQEDSDN